MSRRLLQYFAGTPRSSQSEAAPHLERAIREADVVCLLGPVGCGKSKLIEAASLFAIEEGLAPAGAVISLRTNALLDQFQRSLSPRGRWTFLRRKDSYSCPELELSCEERHAEVGGFCKKGGPATPRGCPYVTALRSARIRGARVCTNWHLQMAHHLKPSMVCIDEAHGVPDFLAELNSKTYWRRQWGWPRTIETMDDVERWLRDAGGSVDLDPLRDAVSGAATGVKVSWGEDDFRGEPEEFIRVSPLDGRLHSSPLWPASVSKILLASATLSDIDIEAMGLSRRRVAWVKMRSEIPVESRRLLWWPMIDGRHGRHTPEDIGAAIAQVLEHYKGQRGIIHATYSLARHLETSPALAANRHRLLFHQDAQTKTTVLADFLRDVGAGDSRTLVISGQYEGLDLPGDLARFQILTQVPRRSIGDSGYRWLAENRPRDYEWLAVRDLAQAYGRVCRGPDDFGDTILIDSSAGKELDSDLAPDWLKEAVVPV